MLTTGPRLRIRRPSPTTAEFTVTTLPPSTLRLRVLRLLLLTTRISLALATAIALHARWVRSSFSGGLPSAPPPSWLCEDMLWYGLGTVHNSRLGRLLAGLVEDVPTSMLLPGALVLAYVLSWRVHSSESLLVMRGLGVQTSESPGTYLASYATRFIPTEKIQDIFVNEAFRGFEVRYYLVVVVEGEEDVVVVFPGLLPRRDIVEAVWRGARECLYESGKGSFEEKG